MIWLLALLVVTDAQRESTATYNAHRTLWEFGIFGARVSCAQSPHSAEYVCSAKKDRREFGLCCPSSLVGACSVTEFVGHGYHPRND